MISVTPFRNPSGSVAFRAAGTIHGVRHRRNFKSRAEAELYADRMNRGEVQGVRDLVLRATWLAEAQVREAELATDLVGDGGLMQFVRDHGGGMSRVRPVELASAIREYTDQRARSGCRPKTVSVCRSLLDQWARGLVVQDVPRSTADVAPRDVEDFVYSDRVKPATQRDRRKHLRQFLAWCVTQGYAARSPAENLPQIRVDPEPPQILSVPEAQRLLRAARATSGGRMLGYTVLGLFSGVRPEEARRLEDCDFHLRPRGALVEVTARVAKVRQVRQVELSANAVRLLRTCGPPIVSYSQRVWRRIRETAEVFDLWQNDVLRHTYASHHYALHQDMRRLVYTMGNSEQILFRHYIRPVSQAEARRFFALRA